MKIICTWKLIRKIQRIRIRCLCVYRTPLTHRTSNRPPLTALSINSGTGDGCPDRKMLYIKVTQNGSTITNTLPAYPPHPSNIANIEPSRSGPPIRWIVRYCYSARMNLFRTRKLFGIDQPPRIPNPHVCRMSTTPPVWFPPPTSGHPVR